MNSYPLYAKEITGKNKSSPSGVTGSDILGPFYRPGAPWTSDLALEYPGQQMSLSGTIKDTDGKSVPCYIEFWQADTDGKYDENGPKFRGIQHAVDGTYNLKTVKPGFYDISEPTDPQPHDFRCSHIHVKIWINGVDVLTTQLYFADSPYDNTDHWFNKNRCIKFIDDNNGTFDFVLKLKK